MHSTTTIRNIVFDMGEVLLRLNPQRAIAAYEALGAVQTAQYIRDSRSEDMFLDIETGAMTMAQFCDAVQQKDSITATDEDILAAWDSLLEPMDDEHRKALMLLREHGYHLFVLSNTCPLHWHSASTRLISAVLGQSVSTFFERCFLSYELHCRKPAKEIFLAMVQQAGIAPSATVFVDDSESNILAAQEIGFHTFHEGMSHRWTTILTQQLL